MRIIAGAFRGKRLAVPPGLSTRPTSDRLRQSVFDMVMHAPWGGHGLIEGACVLDAFAGTGAMGLEALSRGAGRAVFMDRDRAAVASLHANIAACGVQDRARVLLTDVLQPPPGPAQTIIFLDPPYEQGLLQPAINALRASGWLTAHTIVIAECNRLEEPPHNGVKLAQRLHGVAQVNVWRET